MCFGVLGLPDGLGFWRSLLPLFSTAFARPVRFPQLLVAVCSKCDRRTPGKRSLQFLKQMSFFCGSLPATNHSQLRIHNVPIECDCCFFGFSQHLAPFLSKGGSAHSSQGRGGADHIPLPAGEVHGRSVARAVRLDAGDVIEIPPADFFGQAHQDVGPLLGNRLVSVLFVELAGSLCLFASESTHQGKLAAQVECYLLLFLGGGCGNMATLCLAADSAGYVD